MYETLVDLNGNTVNILNYPHILDKVDPNDIGEKTYKICSAATNNNMIDLRNATFYRVYNKETHSIEMYPAIDSDSITFAEKNNDKIFTAKQITNTDYIITSDNELRSKSDYIRFEDKYDSIFFDTLGMLVPRGKVMYIVLGGQPYIFSNTTLQDIFPDITISFPTPHCIYDIISGKTFETVMDEQLERFTEKATTYYKEHHANDHDDISYYEYYKDNYKDNYIDKRVKHHKNKLLNDILTNGILYDAHDPFVKQEPQTRLNNIDRMLADMNINDITYTMSLSANHTGDRFHGEHIYMLSLTINVSYKNESLIDFIITDEKLRLAENMHKLPKLDGSIYITPTHRKRAVSKFPLDKDACSMLRISKELNDCEESMCIHLCDDRYGECDIVSTIQNMILSAKNKVDHKNRKLTFTKLECYSNPVFYAFTKFGDQPCIVVINDDHFYVYAQTFTATVWTHYQMSCIKTWLGQFSAMSTAQYKTYVKRCIDSMSYKIKNGTDAEIAKDLCELINVFREDTAKYCNAQLAHPNTAYCANRHVFTAYSKYGFIGIALDGKILHANDLPRDKEETYMRLISPDKKEKCGKYTDTDILITEFNKINTSKDYLYPVCVRIDVNDINSVELNKHTSLEVNIAELFKLLHSTEHLIGNYTQETMDIDSDDEYDTKTIIVRTSDCKRYKLTIKESKKDPIITVELQHARYYSEDDRLINSLTIKDDLLHKFDNDTLGRIANHMIETATLFNT